LNPLFKGQLEKLFFFNERQGYYIEEILETMRLFGDPKMVQGNDGLWIHLPKVPHAQCLFGVDSKKNSLVGVAIYTREELDELEILHLATCSAWQGTDHLEVRLGHLLSQIINIGKKVRGIEKIRLPYGRGVIRVMVIEFPKQSKKWRNSLQLL
jgi:hypothetical protein